MKKWILTIVVVALCGAAAYWWLFRTKNSNTEKGKAEENTESIMTKKFIEAFYYNEVFFRSGKKIPGFEDVNIDNSCSPELKKRLHYVYEHEYGYEGDGFAVWEFRTGANGGISDVDAVDSIVAFPNNWYRVFYTDMGCRGVTDVLVQTIGDKPQITDYKLIEANIEAFPEEN